MEPETITIEQALLRINDHLGEKVHLELYIEAHPMPHSVLELDGELSRIHTIEGAGSGDEEERDFLAAAYMIGTHAIHVGNVTGPIACAPHGIAFRLSGDVYMALTWVRDSI